MTSEEIENCGICYCDITQDNKIILKCNHIYCYSCIYDCFKSTLNVTDNNTSTLKIRECPICNTACDILPYKKEFPTIYNVNSLKKDDDDDDE